jgi:hypothetical protein
MRRQDLWKPEVDGRLSPGVDEGGRHTRKRTAEAVSTKKNAVAQEARGDMGANNANGKSHA